MQRNAALLLIGSVAAALGGLAWVCAEGSCGKSADLTGVVCERDSVGWFLSPTVP